VGSNPTPSAMKASNRKRFLAFSLIAQEAKNTNWWNNRGGKMVE